MIGLHPICAILFTLGYAIRAYCSFGDNYIYNTQGDLITYIMSQVFIFVCPYVQSLFPTSPSLVC